MKTDPEAQEYDIIVIGSGVGGLTVASLMTQLRGKRVLVLEKHNRPGGYTHDFKRGRFHFDTGFHYLGQMHEESMMRRMIDLVLGRNVDWVPMPDPYDTFIYPDLSANVYFDPERTIGELTQIFPKEARAIKRYFKDVKKAAAGLAMQMQTRNGWWFMRGIAAILRKVLRQSPTLTTKEYLDAHFHHPQLKALLVSQWGDYGLPPAQSPFGLHSMVVNFFSRGGYYPKGGSGTIGASVKEIVENGGGRFALRREVTHIIIKHGCAVGVQATKASAKGGAKEEQYFAPVVVSNAGAAETYLNLIPDDQPLPFRDEIRRFFRDNPPTTNMALFLGLSKDPRELEVNGSGLNGANLWIYDRLDHDEIFALGSSWFDNGSPGHAYVSFHSIKDPEAEAHSAEILTFTDDYSFFSKWRDQPWKGRDEEYQKLKERISGAMLAHVDRFVPGFADSVEFQELGTPLSNEFFTSHYQGASYGIKSVPARFSKANLKWTHPKTPIKGLFLTGMDVAGLGVTGAMMGGLMCVSHLPDRITMLNVRKAASKKS
jgi:all-trans-retinol 13,14-reductase